MSRFKVKLRIQGLELEIEGDRREVGIIGQAVGEQVASLMAPTNEIVQGMGGSTPQAVIDSVPVTIKRKRRIGKKNNSQTVGQSGPTSAIDFRHDPQRFGTPVQSWKTAQKAIWLMFVAGEMLEAKQLSTGVITTTFNKLFKQAGAITNSNVSRDLGKAKLRSGDVLPLVGEDTTKTPPEWFLTDEGSKQARALIEQSRGPTSVI